MSIKKRLRSWLGVSPRSGKGFNDEDRERSAEIRALKAEQRQLREQMSLEREKFELEKLRLDIEEQKAELYDTDDEEQNNTEETLLMPLLLAVLNKGTTPFPVNSPLTSVGVPLADVEKVDFSDEEIKHIISQIPKRYIKLAKNSDETLLRKLAASQFPNANDTSISRAIQILKS